MSKTCRDTLHCDYFWLEQAHHHYQRIFEPNRAWEEPQPDNRERFLREWKTSFSC